MVIDWSTVITGILGGFSAGIGASLATYFTQKLLLKNIDKMTEEVAKRLKNKV